MSNKEVQELISIIFTKIKAAKSTAELEAIFDDPVSKEMKACRMDEKSYPKLNFKITAEELKDAAFITQNGMFSHSLSTEELSPLTKLLYAVCWKNGDLKKVKHIIQGIRANAENKEDKEDGLVFYQFGKYLTKKPGEPIIDQHVLRAFAIYKNENPDEKSFNQIRIKSIINKNDLILIQEYKTWLSNDLTEDLKSSDDYCYYIDQLLFALGKAIKMSAKSKNLKNDALLVTPNQN